VTVSELLCDIRVYDTPNVIICEIMGRNAGWLTCASALANLNGYGKPQLIYIPEIAFCEEQFLADVRAEMEKSPFVLVCVSEGVKDSEGNLVCERHGEKQKDVFGHKHLSGVGKYLANLVRQEIGCKTRDIELSLMQRCSSHIASATDIEESRMLGAAALDRAFHGGSGEMSVIKRISTLPYQFRIETTSIENVANHEKLVPLDWMNEKRNNVTQKMIDYLTPLIQGECHVRYKNGIPEHIKLY
jgi:6-phosphofructokinase 1